MGFGLNNIKQKLFNKNSIVRKQDEGGAVSQKDKNPNKMTQAATGMVADAKRGLNDIKRVLDEGNYRLFVKQLVVLLLVFLGIRFFNDKLSQQKASFVDQISAISIQQANEQDYLDNKMRLLRLESIFPDLSNKNEWLLRKIMDTLESHQIQANISGNIAESSSSNYTVMAQPVTFQQEFFDLGKFIADIENGDDFLRISELSISKMTDSASLGKNTINMKINTLFPKEKYGPRLFKDYAKQMQDLKASQENASKAAETTNKAEITATTETADQTEPTPAEENVNAQ